MQEFQDKLMQKVNETFNAKTAQIAEKKDGGADAKNIGWKAKLEEMKNKKKLKSMIGSEIPNDAAALRQQFAPAAGIKKDETGKLVVHKEEVQKKPDAEEILRKMEEDKRIAALKKEEEAKQPPAAATAASGIKKPTPATAATGIAKPGHSRLVSNADKIKEKQAQLKEERQSRLTKTSTTAAAATGRASVATKSTLNSSMGGSRIASKTGLNSTLRSA